jgi:hypothetical protein
MTTENKGGRTILIIVAVVALLGVVAYALGLFNVDASGELKTPEVAVDVTGGEVPSMEVETADVDVGTKSVDVDVPTVSVTPAGDDGSTKQ